MRTYADTHPRRPRTSKGETNGTSNKQTEIRIHELVFKSVEEIISEQECRELEEIVVCEVDLSQVEETKKQFSFPYRDRRVDSYDEITRLYSD